MVLSVMMTSLCKEYYQFMLAQGIMGGIASGMLFAPVMTCVSHYFHQRRSAALGVTVSGSSIGGIIFPIALSKMLKNESVGFGWSVRIVGFIILFMVLITMVTIRERLPPRRGKIFLAAAFTRAPYVLVTLGIFFMMWGLFTPFFYLPQYAQSHGMGSQNSTYLLSILNAGSVFGRILPGIVADKIGRFNILVINSVCAGIILLCWIAATSNSSIIAFAVIYGFFSGGDSITNVSLHCPSDPKSGSDWHPSRHVNGHYWPSWPYWDTNMRCSAKGIRNVHTSCSI